MASFRVTGGNGNPGGLRQLILYREAPVKGKYAEWLFLMKFYP